MVGLVRAAALAALLLVFAAPCAARAAAPSPQPSASPSPAALPEIGRVVTSDRHAEPIGSTTRPTFTVDRASIENYGARSVADALAAVPGMSLFSYGAFGAQANYGIRGTTSAQTLVLRDGVPVIAASTASVDLGSLPTLGVARIEVVESGSSTLYGTSAAGGVINLISDAQGAPYARLGMGSFGDRDVAAGFGNGTFSLTVERHVATNAYAYPAFPLALSGGTLAGTRANADAEQTAARMSYRAALGGGWTARLVAGGDAIRIGVPGSLTFGTTPDARQNASRGDAQVELAHALGRGTLFVTAAGFTQRLAYADPGPQLGGEDDTYDARVQGSVRYVAVGPRADVVAGVDVAREAAALSFAAGSSTGPPTAPLAAAESQSAAYAQLGYQASVATRITAGVRAENDAPHGGVIAPALGIAQRFGAARLTAGAFGRAGSNLIALDPTTFLPFNASRVVVNGLQVVASTAPYRHLRATASVTDLYRALDTGTGARLPATPTIFATLGLERAFDGGPLAFGARFRVVGATPGVPAADPATAFATADAYLRYRAAHGPVTTLRVRNAGSERYAPITGYPAPGRSVELELATR